MESGATHIPVHRSPPAVSSRLRECTESQAAGSSGSMGCSPNWAPPRAVEAGVGSLCCSNDPGPYRLHALYQRPLRVTNKNCFCNFSLSGVKRRFRAPNTNPRSRSEPSKKALVLRCRDEVSMLIWRAYETKSTCCRLGDCAVAFGHFFAVFLTIIYASSAVAKTGAGALNPVETWVVAQVRIGEIADLSKQFPDKEKDKRRLSAHFLEDLLMGALTGLKPHRHGVRIIGAIIDEPIDLQNAQIRCQVWLDHCQFNKSVTFYGANFAEFVSFENSAFKAEANFESMKVGGTAFFQNAVFDGPVNFVSADIGWLEANGAQFRNKEKLATFGAMKVGGTAFFQNAVFDGPVNFVGANIASDFGAQGAKFQNKEQGANFESMKVRHTAFFQNAVFDGPVNFVGANIASNFQANGVQFQNMEQRANFNSMKVGGAALFNDAVF